MRKTDLWGRRFRKTLPLLFLIFWPLLTLGAEELSFLQRLSRVLSPGPLSKSHSYLENNDGCPKCHTSTSGLSDKLCLTCHEEIDKRIKEKKGYHGLDPDKPCNKCHGEHKGKEMITYDISLVNHKLLSFPLRGGHNEAKCEDCHNPKTPTTKHPPIKIDGRIKQLPTFLNAPIECEDCHNRPHGTQFQKKKCTNCHVEQTWKELKFSHQKDSQYPLTGKHLKVACSACHKPVKDPLTVVVYEGIPGKGKFCKECHKDPHEKKFGTKCYLCHVNEGWKEIKEWKLLKEFDHSKLDYPLEGKHQKVDCIKCHEEKKQRIFKLGGYKFCDRCHKDPHKGQFTNQKCKVCHDVIKDWKKSSFDHQKSPFPLTPLHEQAKCKDCHPKGNFKLPLEKECEQCHSQIRKIMSGSAFGKKGEKGPDPMFRMIPCENCHDLKDKNIDEQVMRKRCVECHNKAYGILWDYRSRQFGKRPANRTKKEKSSRLKKTHRFAEEIE